MYKDKVVFCSFGGKGFGDNPKYIAIKLHELNPNLRLYWIVKDMDSELPEWIKKVKLNSIHSVYELSTSKVWVDNARKPLYIKKRKEQFYIQTWHGGIGLKYCEGDTLEPLPEEWIRTSKHDSEMIDLMVSNSTFCTKMYKRAFWYQGDIIEAGSPRCDILYNCNLTTIQNIREKLKIKQDALVVLYAPTFRSNESIDVYDIDVDKVIETYRMRTGRDVVFLLRYHPLTRAVKQCESISASVINVTSYPDMYELMSAADVLITDYSSSMMEFMFAGKEVQLYVKDYDDYSKERGCVFSLEELPFALNKTNAQLIQSINNFNGTIYKENTALFAKQNGLKETGNASTIIANVINKKIVGEES